MCHSKNKSLFLIDKLYKNEDLTKSEFIELLENKDKIYEKIGFLARKVSEENFGKKVYLRGLVEISNFCKNDCYYCGIRKSNKNINRYRLSKDEILESVHEGYELGLRTFVLQSGEDKILRDEFLVSLLEEMKKIAPEAAITLSLGERRRNSYEKLYKAGADRYLLRHETINKNHYEKLHPEKMKLKNRIRCLKDLYKIGYQAGTGFMVGSPYQSVENLAEDLLFLQNYKPHMVGIGPFIPHKDTKFKNFPPGDLKMTLLLLGIIRLMLPNGNIPATTALATLSKNGHIEGIKMGANVIMPNLSPSNVRKDYSLYDKKASFGSESIEGLKILKDELSSIGYEISFDRGDHIDFKGEKINVQ